MDLTKTRGLWLHDPAEAMGKLHGVKALGFDYVMPKIADGRSGYKVNTTQTLLKDAASMGMPVLPWIYAYPDSPEACASNVEAMLPAGCRDLAVDIEIEFEKSPSGAAQAEALLHAIAEATGHRVNLWLSSFWSPVLHPQFPFASAMKHCAGWMPQAYREPNSRPTQQILDATLQQAAGIKKPTQPTILTVNDTAFVPLLKAKGITGFNVWAWDRNEADAVSTHRQAWQQALSA